MLKTTCAVTFLLMFMAINAFSVEPTKNLRAKDVFDLTKTIIFQDDFSSGSLARWNISEDDRYRLLQAAPERIAVVDAPGLAVGKKAARFFVPRALNSFRAEISLPHENGYHERWYGVRIQVPEGWITDNTRGNDIVIQWHAIPGNGKPTNPNLEISVGNNAWYVRQAYGELPDKKKRTNIKLMQPVIPGKWVSWVVHAKWSPGEDGVLNIWQDGKQVVERIGPNVYSHIDVEYTPYVKTGIYHPEWHTDSDEKIAAFQNELPKAMSKTIYVTDFKMGSEVASYNDVTATPRVLAQDN